jgi:hypothetical protein
VALRHPEYVGPAEAAVILFLSPIILLAVVIVAWRVCGRERIASEDDVLRVTRNIGPIARSVSVPLSGITRVSLADVGRREMQNNVFGIGHPALVLECGSAITRCGIALGPGEAAALAGQIQRLAEERRRRTRG